MAKQHNLLPLETLVDVVETHKTTKIKTVSQMTLEKYYALKNADYKYQAFQIGFINKDNP